MNNQQRDQRDQLLDKIEALISSFKFETYDDVYALECDICNAVYETFPIN